MQINTLSLQSEHQNILFKDVSENRSVEKIMNFPRRCINNEISDRRKKINSNKKLYQSRHLLVNNSYNISEIAYSLGFNDPKYFSRCFKRKFGITPKKFRETKLKSLQVSTDLNYDENFISKANAIVEQKISEHAFGVDKLANELNVSYSTLYRKMKTTSGISPCDFIRKARIKNATKMMAKKNLSFSDIAFAAGFCNYSYFSRCFKSEFGLFPSEYARKLNLG